MLDSGAIVFLGIQEKDAGGIGWITVTDESDILPRCCGAARLIHGDDGRLCSPVIGHVIGCDFQVPRGDEEKDVLLFSQDLYIGFIACLDVIDLAFVGHVETAAIKNRSPTLLFNHLLQYFYI